MVSSAARSVAAYLADLPAERRAVVSRVRQEILAHLPAGYEEAMNWGMICYQVPLAVLPDTYNDQPLAYAALAAQKNNYAVYLMGPYGHAPLRQRIEQAFKSAGKRLDMGKSCLRFKRLEDVPDGLIGEVVGAIPMARYVASYRAVKGDAAKKPAAKKRTATKRTATKRTAKKPAARKPAAKKPTSRRAR